MANVQTDVGFYGCALLSRIFPNSGLRKFWSFIDNTCGLGIKLEWKKETCLQGLIFIINKWTIDVWDLNAFECRNWMNQGKSCSIESRTWSR